MKDALENTQGLKGFDREGARGMDKETCHRCFQEEGIPTHQYVKFDDKVQYLCRQCWEGFRRWFHWGQCDQKDRQLELF